ncbi:MAG: hypothetical protein ACI9O5_000106, partial [Algoriphagus sp.]
REMRTAYFLIKPGSLYSWAGVYSITALMVVKDFLDLWGKFITVSI